MTCCSSAGDFAEIIGIGITSATGNSAILLALVVIGGVSLFMWYRRATMQETYFMLFFILGVLRVYSDNIGSFGDQGLFGLLHNLFLLASAIAFAKIMTGGPSR